MRLAKELEALNIYQERDMVGQVQAVSQTFQRRLHALADHALVGETRKEKLDPALNMGTQVFEETKKNGLLFRAAGDTLLLCPPLIVMDADVNEIFDILENALNTVAKRI